MVVRPVNLRVARGAVLEAHGRLVVEAGRVWRRTLTNFQCDIAVAFQTELIHVVALEQLGIAGSVRGMADRAAFDFRRRMLEHEGPLLVGMALHAGGVSSGIEARLFLFESPVRIVAIAALPRA